MSPYGDISGEGVEDEERIGGKECKSEARRLRAGCLQGLPARYREGLPLPGLQSRLGCEPTAHPSQPEAGGEGGPGAFLPAPGWDCGVRDPHCRCTRSARGPGPALSGMPWGGGHPNPHRLFKCVLPPRGR